MLICGGGPHSLHQVVHEPDHFSVPKGGTNSSHVICKDHTDLKLLGMTIQSMEVSTQVHNV